MESEGSKTGDPWNGDLVFADLSSSTKTRQMAGSSSTEVGGHEGQHRDWKEIQRHCGEMETTGITQDMSEAQTLKFCNSKEVKIESENSDSKENKIPFLNI